MFSRFKTLLRPPEAKASRTARLIQLESGGRARWTPREFAALTREGYMKNAIVHRSVHLVAESAASLCLLLYEGASELTRHPLLDLLARPNPRQDGATLLEAVYASLLLAGNAYLEAVAVDGQATASVRELYALRADRMRVVPGPDGWPEAYEYTVAGSTIRFDQAAPLPPILHLALYHPLDDHYGLPPLEAAAVAVDTHNAAARWNKALLDNAARPSTNPFSAKLNNTLWAAKTVAAGGDGNLRYKLSKESAAKTLSLLFQDNFSGRAEIGLTGDDDFHFKVSPDGSTWSEAIVVDKTTGKVTLRGFTDAVASRALLYAAPSDALAYSGMQINGAMDVSQENGTGAVTLTGTGALQIRYLLDGVMAAYRGTFVATAQQAATPFVGGRYALKATVGTAEASLGANDELTIFIPFEGTRVSRLALGTASAAYQSLGFWFQAHRTGTYSGSIRNAAKDRSYPFTFMISAADTPTWVSLSGALAIPGLTSGTWAIDTSVGMYVSICLAGGSSRVGTANTWGVADYSGATGTANGVAATSDVFYIGNLILVPGIELPAWDRAAYIMRAADEELVRCKRHFERINFVTDDLIALGFANNANELYGIVNFVEKRLAPVFNSLTASWFKAQVGFVDITGMAAADIGAHKPVTSAPFNRALLHLNKGQGQALEILGNGTGNIDINARL